MNELKPRSAQEAAEMIKKIAFEIFSESVFYKLMIWIIRKMEKL